MKTKIINELKNGETIDNVCRKYNISFAELMFIAGQSENSQKKNEKLPPHIYRKHHLYTIKNKINDECVCFGEFRTLKEANKVLRMLIANNWELDPARYLNMKYIHKRKNDYLILKCIDGEQKRICKIGNKSDAIKIRDALVKVDWDLDYLPLICRQAGVLLI